MRIGDFAARAGLTARQVRHYTDVGLLSATRLGNGYRDYDPRTMSFSLRMAPWAVTRRTAPSWSR